MNTIVINCTNDCDQGRVQKMNCKDYSSNCCGGCYKDVDCESCGGHGVVEVDMYEHFDKQISKYKMARQALMNALTDAGVSKTESKTIIKNL